MPTYITTSMRLMRWGYQPSENPGFSGNLRYTTLVPVYLTSVSAQTVFDSIIWVYSTWLNSILAISNLGTLRLVATAVLRSRVAKVYTT